MKNNCVLYCRVSSREQEETGYSLPSQEKLLKEYALKKNLDVIRVFSVAESASGAKQRKVFAEMMEYMEKHKISDLLCEKVDRLTRNLREAVVANDWLELDQDRKIHFVKQNLVLHKFAKSDEKFRWDMEIVLAKKYISNLSEEVRKGQTEKLRQGWLPTKPPMGYKTEGEKGHKIHVQDNTKAPFIRKIFDLYGSGNHSMKSLIEYLFENGFRSRFGKRLAKSQIESVLSDPFYYGAMRWNDVVYQNGRHTPLISKELFDKVQEIRTGKKTPSMSKHKFQFRKLFTCGECKGTLTAEIHKGIIYYHCSHYRGCAQKKYTPERDIENKLLQAFDFFKNITAEEAELVRLKIKENHAQEIEYKESVLRASNERYSQLQRRLDNLYNDRLDNKIPMELWEKKNKEIIDEQAGIQEQIRKLKGDEAKYFELWLNILDLAHRSREIYEKHKNPEDRRLLLSHIFSNLVITDGNMAYSLKKPVQVFADRIRQHIDEKKVFEPQKTIAIKRQNDSFESLSPALLPN